MIVAVVSFCQVTQPKAITVGIQENIKGLPEDNNPKVKLEANVTGEFHKYNQV
jgi:hypothetical protein